MAGSDISINDNGIRNGSGHYFVEKGKVEIEINLR